MVSDGTISQNDFDTVYAAADPSATPQFELSDATEFDAPTLGPSIDRNVSLTDEIAAAQQAVVPFSASTQLSYWPEAGGLVLKVTEGIFEREGPTDVEQLLDARRETANRRHAPRPKNVVEISHAVAYIRGKQIAACQLTAC